MTYVAWSVTFGEQPTAAKWNILGTNDASFNDGTGIGTSAIDSDNLQTDSHIIAYDEGPATGQSTTSTSDVDVTGVSVTFTTPLSCTKILLRAEASVSNNTANASIVLGITDSSNVVQVDRSTIANAADANQIHTVSLSRRISVTANTSYTFKLRFRVSTGTGVINQGDVATRIPLIWVERA